MPPGRGRVGPAAKRFFPVFGLQKSFRPRQRLQKSKLGRCSAFPAQVTCSESGAQTCAPQALLLRTQKDAAILPAQVTCSGSGAQTCALQTLLSRT